MIPSVTGYSARNGAAFNAARLRHAAAGEENPAVLFCRMFYPTMNSLMHNKKLGRALKYVLILLLAALALFMRAAVIRDARAEPNWYDVNIILSTGTFLLLVVLPIAFLLLVIRLVFYFLGRRSKGANG